MAKLSGPFKFIGTLDELNAYKMTNSDNVIVRGKPGPTARQVKTSRSFERTRENYKDFGGASVFSKEIRRVVRQWSNLTYSYLSGQLTALGKQVSKLDNEHRRGQRSILITKVHHWLTDYDLNKKSLFHTALRAGLPYSIDRETGTALVHIPELLPGIQLQPTANYAFYRLHFVLGVVTDIVWNSSGYRPAEKVNRRVRTSVSTEWHACNKKRIADDIAITISPEAPLADSQSLILYAGIEWGVSDEVNQIKPVPKKGCAKIMGLA
jgi:hypothetical protein